MRQQGSGIFSASNNLSSSIVIFESNIIRSGSLLVVCLRIICRKTPATNSEYGARYLAHSGHLWNSVICDIYVYYIAHIFNFDERTYRIEKIN